MPSDNGEVTAVHIDYVEVDGFPLDADWCRAEPVSFEHDWQGRNADPRRQTEVRLLWNEERLLVRFVCRYRTLNVFEEAEADGRRDRLWERDVAEVFLQPDRFGSGYYREFEVAPNSYWIDLDISPEGPRHIASGMRSRVELQSATQQWTAVVTLPLASLTSAFVPSQSWRVNFFRCEGADPDRFYSAWQPTGTPQPQFHVPEAFGVLRFR